MRKLTGTLFFFLLLVLNTRSALAAVSDCAMYGCVAVCTDAGPVNLYRDDGALAGTIINVGTGQCRISADEGYLIITRQGNTTTWIYNIEIENGCFLDIGAAGEYGMVFGSDAYVTTGGNNTVRKVALDCSGYVSIPVGNTPFGITKDATTIYVLNLLGADISTIIPPAITSTLHDIGRQFSDQIGSIQYHAGNNVLYVGGLAGIYNVSLPLSGSSSLWQGLPNQSGEMNLTSTHIAVQSSSGNAAYLVPIADPTNYLTYSSASCRSVALNSDTLYTVGGFTPDVGVKAWDFFNTEQSYSPLTIANSYSADYLYPTLSPPVCPNGTKETGEECDTADFGTETCITQGFDGGSLSCTGSCTIDTSGCYSCGDGTKNPGEQCDDTDVGTDTCVTQGFDGGGLGCDASCNFDTSGCFMNCGNGTIEVPEDCDGVNLDNETCQTQGFDNGTLDCDGLCQFDTTSCTMDTCGNGAIDNGEQCDGTNLDNETCQTIGFADGNLACQAGSSCQFDTSGCTTCGDNVMNGNDECDGPDFGTETCLTQGFDGGNLNCTGGCTIDTSACTLTTCGNGVLDTGEVCDDNNAVAGDGCTANCQVEDGWECSGTPSTCTLLCGNGAIDSGEQCDGDNLNNTTCADLGHDSGGTLSCNNDDCTFNTSACPSCNQDGLVSELVDVSHAELNGLALQRYNENLQTLTKGGGFSCDEYLGVQVVRMDVPVGHYLNIRVASAGMETDWHLYNGAALFVPVDNPLLMHRIGGGDIFLHSGSDIEVKYDTLGLSTLGTAGMLRFLDANPLTHVPGNWIGILLTSASIRLFEFGDQGNTVTLGALEMETEIYLNLDALGDLSEIIKPPKPREDCNGCNNSNSTPSLPVVLALLILFGFYLASRFQERKSTVQIEKRSSKRERR